MYSNTLHPLILLVRVVFPIIIASNDYLPLHGTFRMPFFKIPLVLNSKLHLQAYKPN